MSVYQEEESSTFTHNGKTYSLNILFQEVHSTPVTKINLSEVKWILADSYIDSKRVQQADIKAPILVIYDSKLKLWIVLDGTHRVKKASLLKLTEIPCKVVKESQLNKALIKPTNYYHLSFNEKLEGKWQPKLPNASDNNKLSPLSEPDIPRISFSETIEGCFRAIYPTVSKYFEENNYPWLEFYVYSPVITDKTKILKNTELIQKHYVHDAHITGEVWILNAVEVKYVSKIRIYNTVTKGDLFYHPFNEKKYPKRFHSPKEIIIEKTKVQTKPANYILADIKNLAREIRENNRSFFQYGGFGYCAYFSQLLKNELDKLNIPSTILLGEYFNETIEAEACRKFIEKMIMTFPDQDDGSFYHDIKKHYVKRKGLPKRTGHAVLLINNDIFDITSGQFDLPESYPVTKFMRIWKDLYTAEIQLKSHHQFGIRDNSKVKYSHEDISPSYLKW